MPSSSASRPIASQWDRHCKCVHQYDDDYDDDDDQFEADQYDDDQFDQFE